MSPKERKSPRQHPVHTKHPRYQTPEYQRGQGGGNLVTSHGVLVEQQETLSEIDKIKATKSLEELKELRATDYYGMGLSNEDVYTIGNEIRRQNMKLRVMRDANQLSSGTLATLTGKSRYDILDRERLYFVTWLENQPVPYKSWQDAWNRYTTPSDKSTIRYGNSEEEVTEKVSLLGTVTNVEYMGVNDMKNPYYRVSYTPERSTPKA